MAIRSIIIDDERHNIENLRGMLREYCPDVQVVAVSSNPDEGIAAIRQHQPDLVFLDIQMPDKSGFDVLKALPSISFEVIFVTAYDQFGLKAIKFSALDYLLKPVDIEEFKTAMNKAREKIAARQKNLNIENLLTYIKQDRIHSPKIALPTFQETLFVHVEQVIRCEASSNYTNVFLQDGSKVLVCKTLKEFAELLKGYHFVRTHQSHLVNLASIKSWLKEDGGALLLHNQDKIPISRQNREVVRTAINGYIQG